MVSAVMNGALTASPTQARTAFKSTAPRTAAPRSACVRVHALAQDHRTPVQAGVSAVVASAAAIILALPGASIAATPSFVLSEATGTEQSSRTGLGPNEVDVKDLQSFPNASEKDAAVPAIQKYAEPPQKQAPKPVPEALKQGVESVADKGVSVAPGRNVFTVADVTGTEQSSRTGLGPNEVDVKDLQSLPNASKKDGAVPAIQKVANPPKKKEGNRGVPEAQKQGVETPQDKSGKKKKGGDDTPKGAATGPASAQKAKGSPQFEAFIRRARGGK
ncbi:hypothetical protein ABBQ32_012760 [Trebouxia sp. C0010 RCD-2024]